MTDTDIGAQLAARLTEAREHAGLSMRALASASGVSVPQVYRLERGDGAAAKLSTLVALASALAVSPAWLAFGEAPPPWIKIRRSRKKPPT